MSLSSVASLRFYDDSCAVLTVLKTQFCLNLSLEDF